MAESVDELGAPENREGSDQASDYTLPSKYKEQQHAKSDTDSQIELGMIRAVIAAELSVERILHQVMGLLLQFFVGLDTIRVEHPLVECVSNTLARGMRIKRGVGLLMVLTVNPNPDNRRAHECEVSSGTNVIFEPFRDSERFVGQEAMVAQRDAYSMPDMPKNCPCGNYQTVGDDRVFKDSQNVFPLSCLIRQ